MLEHTHGLTSNLTTYFIQRFDQYSLAMYINCYVMTPTVMLRDVLYERETFVFEDPDVLNVAELSKMISHKCIYPTTQSAWPHTRAHDYICKAHTGAPLILRGTFTTYFCVGMLSWTSIRTVLYWISPRLRSPTPNVAYPTGSQPSFASRTLHITKCHSPSHDCPTKKMMHST